MEDHFYREQSIASLKAVALILNAGTFFKVADGNSFNLRNFITEMWRLMVLWKYPNLALLWGGGVLIMEEAVNVIDGNMPCTRTGI